MLRVGRALTRGVAVQAFQTLCRFISLAHGAQVAASANCSFDYADNSLRGWYCVLPPSASAAQIPFLPNAFDGVVVVETLASETRILELLRDRKQTLKLLATAAEKRLASKVRERASWKRCRPQREVPLQR